MGSRSATTALLITNGTVRTTNMLLKKVISGGQTGVDRAGLDAAMCTGFETGGFAPKGWKTTDGPAPELAKLGLEESRGGYDVRTRQNALLADATIIFARNFESPGTALTVRILEQYGKPFELVGEQVVSNTETAVQLAHGLAKWIFCEKFATVNIAGNSERSAPGIYAYSRAFFERLFALLRINYKYF